MIIIFKLGPRDTEEWLSGNKFEDKAAETPDINAIVNSTGKNQLRWSKTGWSNGLCWRVGKEVRYPRSGISMFIQFFFLRKKKKNKELTTAHVR